MRAWLVLLLPPWVAITPGFSQRPTLKLPEPPHQRIPWRAPAGIPTSFLSAAETLLAQGFPDPRGCEYRELEVEVGDVWGGKASWVKTRGWTLPAKSGDSQRFAVCWNGLVYPVSNIGAAASLHAETTNTGPAGRRYFEAAIGESGSVLSTCPLSTRRLLLLCCGETQNVLQNWMPNRQTLMRSRATNGWTTAGIGTFEEFDPYLEFAGDWAWALFDRTICAHMRGDEALALATARKLADVQPKIEAEAARRGFAPQRSYDGSGGIGKEKPCLDFLGQLPQILADLERRAKEGPRVSVLEVGLTNIPAQSERIAALVRDLDLVHARQWGQPGLVNPAEDSVVQALIREGDPAVEPLLDCLEKDKRLTRSVGFGRDFWRNRTVLPVTSAASVALRAILHANFGGGVPEMRAYWNKYKGLKLEDRWYAILNDDAAGVGRWKEAAANITQPENLTTYPGTGFREERTAPTNVPVRLRGEQLRGKSNPSVAELLARRAIEIPAANPGAYDLSVGCELGLRLAAWDPPSALPVARLLMERCRTVTQYSDQKNPWVVVAKLTMVRTQAGDLQALDDYAAWLQNTSPEQFEPVFAEAFEPLCKYATNATLQVAAERLFGDTNSPLSSFPWKEARFSDPVGSDLVKLPAFRRLLIRELGRKTLCGSVEWRQRTASYLMTNYMSGSRGINLPEGERPVEGARAELRWCDWIAWSLANAKQIPPFNVFAPPERRDEALAVARALLEPR